jgi:branched-chain amino acid transport system permease protein
MTVSRRDPLLRIGGGLAVLAAFAAVPQVTSSFYTSLASSVLIFGLLAMSLDLLAGYAGLISFGHAAYLGLGAYGLGYAETHGRGPLTSAAFAVAIVLAVSLVLGFVAVRATGLAFGMVTLSLGGILWGLAYRWVSVSGGDQGLAIVARPRIGGLDLAAPTTYYYAILVVVAVSALVLRVVVASPFGLSLRGIRDDERRMRTLGYAVALHKYVAYVVAGLFAGVAGVLYGFYSYYVTPGALDIPHNFLAVMMIVLGGVGTLWGGLVGAAIVVLMQQWLSLYVERWQTIMGVAFVLIVLFARSGVYGTVLLAVRRLRRPRSRVW